jgi:hypothetical protein
VAEAAEEPKKKRRHPNATDFMSGFEFAARIYGELAQELSFLDACPSPTASGTFPPTLEQLGAVFCRVYENEKAPMSL